MAKATDDIEVVFKDLMEVTEKVIVKVTLDITANLIATTPVDVGWARANWVPAIGAPVSAPVATPETVNAGAQQSGMAQVAGSYKLAKGTVFISNNVPYIMRLNEGWSKQAPAGFVQNAIDKAIRQDLQGLAT